MTGAKDLRAWVVVAQMSLKNDILAKDSGRERRDLAAPMIFSLT